MYIHGDDDAVTRKCQTSTEMLPRGTFVQLALLRVLQIRFTQWRHCNHCSDAKHDVCDAKHDVSGFQSPKHYATATSCSSLSRK